MANKKQRNKKIKPKTKQISLKEYLALWADKIITNSNHK